MNLIPGRTTRLEIDGTDLTRYVRQSGSYGWAKDVAQKAATLELRLQELAVLVGKPYEVIKDQVSELARAARVDSLVIVSQLEYNHHYRMVQKTELPPARESDRCTVRLNGKPYHWAAGLGGRLRLVPGESPW
jgi:hypothetical protein